MEMLIKNAVVVSPADNLNEKADILIKDGVIAKIGSGITSDGEVIDAGGLCAVPGFVDMHVHLRDPGQTHKEDIITGCKAAAAGGVTSLLAMPNTNPTTDSPEIVKYILDKAKDADSRVYVAASVTKELKSEEPTDIDAVKSAGAIALTDDGRPVENTKYLSDAMKKAPKLGMTIVAHCEDLFLADGGKINEGEVSEKLGVKGIPAGAEDCGTAREIALAAALNEPIHICHVSTKTSVALIRDAKRRGVKVTAETAPHYVSLTDRELLRGDADYRMNPPLRAQADVDEIINGLCDGTLDAIATDHAPHSADEKSKGLEKSLMGVVGLETALPVLYTNLVKNGVISLERLIELMSTNPRKRFKISTDIGLSVFDVTNQYIINPNGFKTKGRATPFSSISVIGRCKATVYNQKVIYQY